MKKTFLLTLTLIGLFACENRDINEGEEFKPREIHEDIVFHFDKITVDGVEYLILEKDNNNPHEGFGFMALRGNRLFETQDTIVAYLRTLKDLQVRTYAAVTRRTVDEVAQEADDLFAKYLEEKASDLKILQQSEQKSTSNQLPQQD